MSNHKKPTIIWEKWQDPYGLDNEFDDMDYEDIDNDQEYPNIVSKHIILTNMGMIPYNEYTDCTKIFNFWVGHTNFSLSANIVNIIQEIEGVETLDIFTRYRFRIAFAKAFKEREVINNINNTIKSIFVYE
jgi:hypothetical protein